MWNIFFVYILVLFGEKSTLTPLYSWESGSRTPSGFQNQWMLYSLTVSPLYPRVPYPQKIFYPWLTESTEPTGMKDRHYLNPLLFNWVFFYCWVKRALYLFRVLKHMILKYLSHSVGFPFAFLTVSFEAQMFTILMKSHLFFVTCAFWWYISETLA